MELFRKIADSTETQLVYIIKKKTINDEVFLTVVCQQDELMPFSFRGTPEGLDESFESSYSDAVAKFKTAKPEKIESNVEEVVAEKEKEEAAEVKKKEETKKKQEESKSKATTGHTADPLGEVKAKIDKLKKADKEKVEKTIKSISTAKDTDVRNFSINELKRTMKELKFTDAECETMVQSAQKANPANGAKKEAPKTGDTGMFAKEEAGMVEVEETEETEELTDEAPWEGDEEPEEPIDEEAAKEDLKKMEKETLGQIKKTDAARKTQTQRKKEDKEKLQPGQLTSPDKAVEANVKKEPVKEPAAAQQEEADDLLF